MKPVRLAPPPPIFVQMPVHVAGLYASRRQSRPFIADLTRGQMKWLWTITAAAAFCGFTLVRLEGDTGKEEFIATRGHETLRFAGVAQVEAWIDLLVEQRAATGAWCGQGTPPGKAAA